MEQVVYLCNVAATPEFNDTIILSLSATECPYKWGYCMDLTSNQYGNGDHYNGLLDAISPCYIGMANLYNDKIVPL